MWTSTETETSVGLVQNRWCCHGNRVRGFSLSGTISSGSGALMNNNGGQGRAGCCTAGMMLSAGQTDHVSSAGSHEVENLVPIVAMGLKLRRPSHWPKD